MNKCKILITLAFSALLCLTVGTAFAEDIEDTFPPPPLHSMFALSGICADQQHLYVMAGGKILRYGLEDQGLQKTVELPAPVPPDRDPPELLEPGLFPPPPPPMAGPHGLWTGNGSLYVLAGPVVYRYTTPDLVLKATIELPEPEFPEVED